jgi:prepilin-type N-terminal cleavage/methylation domain-containing protein
MMFHRLRSINKDQRGFTILEILIAIAVTGLITSGVTGAIFQIIEGSTRSSNDVAAIREVQKAGYWISQDAQMAQDLEMVGVSGFPLTLTWIDWEGDEYQSVYTLASNKIQREYSVNGANTEVSLVAQYINHVGTNCEFVVGIAGGTFGLPDGTSDPKDTLVIADPVGGDSGQISVIASGSVVRMTPLGGATIAGGTDPVIINVASGLVDWATPFAASQIIVVANANNTTGSWTATTGTATVVITEDDDNDTAIAAYGTVALTVTATVGSESETRVYRIAPRASLY